MNCHVYHHWWENKKLVGGFCQVTFISVNALHNLIFSVRANLALIATCTTNREVDLTFSFP